MTPYIRSRWPALWRGCPEDFRGWRLFTDGEGDVMMRPPTFWEALCDTASAAGRWLWHRLLELVAIAFFLTVLVSLCRALLHTPATP